MAVGSQPQELAENWDDDFDFQANGDDPGTKSATPFSSRMRATTLSPAHIPTESPAHLDPFLSSSAFASSSIHAFATKRKLSAPAEEEDWDTELNIAESSILPGSQSHSSTIQHDLDSRKEVKQVGGGIENWDDDFEDASSPQKATTGRPSVLGGDSTRMPGPVDYGEGYEIWDEADEDMRGESMPSQIQLPVSQARPLQKHSIVPSRVSSLQRVDLSKKENDEFGLLSHGSSDDDEDHTVTARRRRLRSASRSRSPQPPLPQLAHASQASLPFPLPTSHPSSPSTLKSPVFSPAVASVTSPSVPPLPIYARSPSAMSGSSAGSSSNIHWAGSHMYQSTTRPSGIGYASASVFSLPNTLHSHTSHGSTVPLNSTNRTRPSASSTTPTSNRLRKQHGAGSSAGFAQLPPSPLVHKERERRRLRKKSRPSVGNRRDVFVVDEDVAGKEDNLSDREQIISHEQPDRPRETDVDTQKAGVDMDHQAQPPPKLTHLEKGPFGQLEEHVIQKLPPPQTPRTSRTARSVSAGPEHNTIGDSVGHGGGGLLGRIGSVKRWAKAKRRRGSTTPHEVEVAETETDRVADGDISVSDFSEQYPRLQQSVVPIQPSASEQVQRAPRPRSSMSSFLNTSRGGSPSPSPASPSKWPNFFRNNDMSSPTGQKSRRRMTMDPVSGTPTPTRTRTNTITRESLDMYNERGQGKLAAPRRSTSQSRSRGAQVYGSALSAARASNGSLALNGSRTSLSSVKEQDSPAPRTRRKSFGRLIMDRLPSAMKTPEKNRAGQITERQTENERPIASVRRISLVNKRAKFPEAPSDEAAEGDNNSSAKTGPQSSAATPTGKRPRSRSRRYDLNDAPPVPEISAPFYGILRSVDSNASQQSLALRRQQSRASSSASHLPAVPAPESWRSAKVDTRAVSTQPALSMLQAIDTPSRPSLSSFMGPSDFGARLRQLGDTFEPPVRSEVTKASSPGRTSNSIEDSDDASPMATSLSLLPPIELHPPSPPQTLGVSTTNALKSNIPFANGTQIALNSSNLSASKSSQGSDIHSATTSTSSLFYTPTSSPNAKKRSAGMLSLSASPHSPGKASSLGRTTGPIVGSESVASMGYSGSATIGKATTLRRNSLGDLKIPSRISQAQVSIRRDLGLVKEFASRIGELKSMKTTYLSLLDVLQVKVGPSKLSTTHNSTSASSLMDLFNDNLDAKPELATNLERGLQDRVTSIKTRYDISWECAELLIELGGGPAPETPETAIASPSTSQSDAAISEASGHSTATENTTQFQSSSQLHLSTASDSSHAPQITPSSIGISQTLASSTLPNIVPKRSRERAITLAGSSSTSGSVPGLPSGASIIPVHEQYQKASGSMKTLPISPSDLPASNGRRDLSQRQLLLLREMLSADAGTNVELPSAEVTTTQPVRGSGKDKSEGIVTGANVKPQTSSANDRETPTTNVGWQWGASSTVELPSLEQEPEAYLGRSRPTGKTIGHRRQWSRVGLGKPSRGNALNIAEVGDDDEEQQKRWKGMRSIRDMLRAMKRVRTGVPQHVSPHSVLPPSDLSPPQPIVPSQLSPPLPSNRAGGPSSRFGVLGVRMGMHSTSSLSSAVSMSSHGSKGHPSGHSNPRAISTGAMSANMTGTGNELDASTQGRLSNQGTAMPQQYQSKAGKTGPRRPSLASLFRVGNQLNSKSESIPVNPRNMMDGRDSTGLSSSLERRGQEDAWASKGNEDEGQEVEDDWDRMDSASDIETRHNATVRGKPDQRRKLLKGHALKSPYLSQPPTFTNPLNEVDATLISNANKHSGQILLPPSFVERPAFSHSTTANENSSSQISLPLSSSDGQFYKLPATNSRTRLTNFSADAGTIRPFNAMDKTESLLPDSRTVPRPQERLENEEVLQASLPQSSAKVQPPSLSSPQYSVTSSLSHPRAPLSPLSVMSSATASDIGISSPHAMSFSAAADSGIALAMTPENIKPLLENAKEVQERLSECIRELTELLHQLRS